MVGLAFLTAASWLVLSELRSATFAATVIGTAYMGASAIALALGVTKPRGASRPAPPNPSASDLSPMQMVILSFIQGFEQGRQKSRKDRDGVHSDVP